MSKTLKTLLVVAGLILAFSLPAEIRATRKIVSEADGTTQVTFDFPNEQNRMHFGPIDPEVGVLRIEDAEGKIVASLVNFGCHPVCIYPSMSTAISADYPAYATRVVEQAEGGICLFALGLAGNAVPFDRGVRPREQVGRALGGEALRRLQLLPTSDDVTLKASRRKVVFPATEAPSADQKHMPGNSEVADG